MQRSLSLKLGSLRTSIMAVAWSKICFIRIFEKPHGAVVWLCKCVYFCTMSACLSPPPHPNNLSKCIEGQFRRGFLHWVWIPISFKWGLETVSSWGFEITWKRELGVVLCCFEWSTVSRHNMSWPKCTLVIWVIQLEKPARLRLLLRIIRLLQNTTEYYRILQISQITTEYYILLQNTETAMLST